VSKTSKKSVKGGKAKMRLPKTECCLSKSRCGRCPLQMLRDGTLPEGYTVKRRKLVRVDGKKFTKKQLATAA